jgi:hypothetical protein
MEDLFKKFCEVNGTSDENMAEAFDGNCYAVSCVLAKMIGDGARAVYGFWNGNSVKRPTASMHRHGWVRMKDGTILDPTVFQFSNTIPFMHKTTVDDERYDQGMKAFKLAIRRPPPERDPSEKTIRFDWSWIHEKFITGLFGEERDWGKMTFGEAHWLANLTVDELLPIVSILYEGLAKSKVIGFVPMDFMDEYDMFIEEGLVQGKTIAALREEIA